MSFPLAPAAANDQFDAAATVLPFSPSPPLVNVADIPERVPATWQATPTIHVLHLVNGEHYSGAERVQDLLARRLPQFGCEVGFACVKPGRFSEARESKHVPLFELPMRSRFDLRIAHRVARIVREEGYDIVHAHTPRTALVGRIAARSAGVPFVYHIHSPASRDSTRRMLNWINSFIERSAVRRAARLIAVSPSVREDIIAHGVAADRVTYVANGVPRSSHAADRQPPVDDWTLGTVALFRPRKGTEVLLESLAALRSRGMSVRLRAVGGFETPAYENAVRNLADRLGLADSVDWIGFTRNVNRELVNMDVLALPSLFGEGLPMVVLEAMAAGLPVVASRVEGVPVAVAHRETGLLVEPGSVSQLTRAIEELIAGGVDYTALSRGARRRHAALFSDTIMASGVAAVYREVLATSEQGAASTQWPALE